MTRIERRDLYRGAGEFAFLCSGDRLSTDKRILIFYSKSRRKLNVEFADGEIKPDNAPFASIRLAKSIKAQS